MSDKGVFLAYEKDEGYLVFSLDDTVKIELGDILSHPQLGRQRRLLDDGKEHDER